MTPRSRVICGLPSAEGSAEFIQQEREMSIKHPVTEHHYNVYNGEWWSVDLGTATNIRRKTTELADQRREGNLPPTLSHWTIGSHKVVGQSAIRLFDRQEEARADFFADLADAIDG